MGWSPAWSGSYAICCDPERFKEFWQKSAGDVRIFGEFVRECMDEWAPRRKDKTEEQ